MFGDLRYVSMALLEVVYVDPNRRSPKVLAFV